MAGADHGTSSRARTRLGAAEGVVRPGGWTGDTGAAVGAWYRGWRLVAVEGTTFDVPDAPSHVDRFGRAGNSRDDGKSASPQAPLAVLAALRAQRCEIEIALDEIKTHQDGPNSVLRSQHPPGVEQEVYGSPLTHHALRSLVHDTAPAAESAPDRLPFIRVLRLVRRQATDQAGFPSTRLGRALGTVRDELGRHLLPPRRRRSTRRVIRRKMFRWRLENAHHQPT